MQITVKITVHVASVVLCGEKNPLASQIKSKSTWTAQNQIKSRSKFPFKSKSRFKSITSKPNLHIHSNPTWQFYIVLSTVSMGLHTNFKLSVMRFRVAEVFNKVINCSHLKGGDEVSDGFEVDSNCFKSNPLNFKSKSNPKPPGKNWI